MLRGQGVPSLCARHTAPVGVGVWGAIFGDISGLVQYNFEEIYTARRHADRRVYLGGAASHKFMPNKLVFPCGKVDAADSRIVPPHDLHPEVMRRLCEGCSQTRALAAHPRDLRGDRADHRGTRHERPQGSGELLDLHWVELSRAQHMEGIPHITRVVLQELERRLRDGDGPEVCGPFMYTRCGRTVIEQI